MAITTVKHEIHNINNAWTDISIETSKVSRDNFTPYITTNPDIWSEIKYGYILETRDDNAMTSTFKFVPNIGYSHSYGEAFFDEKYYNQTYTLNLGTVSNSGNISDFTPPWIYFGVIRVDIPDSSVFTMTHRDAATVQYTLRYTANLDIEYRPIFEDWKTNKYSVVVTQSGTITSEAFNKKLYGSVNNQSERIIKLYGSVNGQSKRIKKLYGGVDGFSKRIF